MVCIAISPILLIGLSFAIITSCSLFDFAFGFSCSKAGPSISASGVFFLYGFLGFIVTVPTAVIFAIIGAFAGSFTNEDDEPSQDPPNTWPLG